MNRFIDALGLIANNFCIDCFISGTGYQLITKDDADMPVLNISTEQMMNKNSRPPGLDERLNFFLPAAGVLFINRTLP